MQKQASTAYLQPKPLISRSKYLKFSAGVLFVISIFILPAAVTGYAVVFGLILATFRGTMMFFDQASLVSAVMYCWMAVGVTMAYAILITIIFAKRKQTYIKVSQISFVISLVFFVIVAILTLSPIFIVGCIIQYYVYSKSHEFILDMTPEDPVVSEMTESALTHIK